MLCSPRVIPGFLLLFFIDIYAFSRSSSLLLSMPFAEVISALLKRKRVYIPLNCESTIQLEQITRM